MSQHMPIYIYIGCIPKHSQQARCAAPCRGKLLNVREATAAQVSQNQEITHIKQILGLQHGKVYDDASSLRYGHLMIMTDQDHDGSHIKGLIMNFLHTFYPSLLKLPGFLLEFITPIIKVAGRPLPHMRFNLSTMIHAEKGACLRRPCTQRMRAHGHMRSTGLQYVSTPVQCTMVQARVPPLALTCR